MHATRRSHEDLLRHCTPDDPHDLGVVGDRALRSNGVAGGVGVLVYRLTSRLGHGTRLSLALVSYLAARTVLRRRYARVSLEANSRTTTITSTPSLSVVVPAYNTGAEIVATVEEINDKLGDVLCDDRGIVVVDDGSDPSSHTVAYAEEAGAFVVAQPCNMGKGAAVRAGFAATTSDVVAFLDGDGAYDPDLLREFLAQIHYYDIVIGVRSPGAAGGRVSLQRNLASRFFHALTSVVLVKPRTDTQAGIKMVRRAVADAFCADGVIDRFSFDVELLALCETRGWRIGEVTVAPREQSASTVKFSSEALRTCLAILQIRRRQARGAYRG